MHRACMRRYGYTLMCFNAASFHVYLFQHIAAFLIIFIHRNDETSSKKTKENSTNLTKEMRIKQY